MIKGMKSIWVEVRGRWSNYPAVDWALTGVVIASHALLVWKADMPQFAELDRADRMRAYTTLATVSSLLFGFATASIAFFYGSARGERVELLKQYFGDRLVASWRGALSAPLLAVAITIAALVVDVGPRTAEIMQWLVASAVALLAFRSVRLRWLFTSTLTLMATDANDDSPKAYSLATKPSVRDKIGPRA